MEDMEKIIATNMDEVADTEPELEPWMVLNTDGIDIPVREMKEEVVEHSGMTNSVRIYYPEGEGPYPVVYFIHGGAYVGGFNGMDEPVCRQICNEADCVVISPEYSLAPQNKFPAALNELYDLLKYFKAHKKEYDMDFEHLAVGGPSAGGNYAAALCVKNYEEKDFDFKYGIFVYPNMELGDIEIYETDKDSIEQRNKEMRELVKAYVPEGETVNNPLISPLYGPAEAFPDRNCLISGREDFLWWEGKHFADKLMISGKQLMYKSYQKTGHGFFELRSDVNITVSRDAKKLICNELKRYL